jgi:hypothetical protein
VAEPTVKNHVTAFLKTLSVTNRTEAVVIGRDLDWEGSGLWSIRRRALVEFGRLDPMVTCAA